MNGVTYHEDFNHKKCPVCKTSNYNEDERYETDYSKYENNKPIPLLNTSKDYTLTELTKKGVIIYHKYIYITRQLNAIFNKGDRADKNNHAFIINNLINMNDIIDNTRGFIPNYTRSTINIDVLLQNNYSIINNIIIEYNNIIKACDSKESILVFISSYKKKHGM
jgi:hypothetical protein